MYKLDNVLNSILDKHTIYSQKFKDIVDSYCIKKLETEGVTLDKLATLLSNENLMEGIDSTYINDLISLINSTNNDFTAQELDDIIGRLNFIYRNSSSLEFKSNLLSLIVYFKNVHKLAQFIAKPNSNVSKLQKNNRYSISGEASISSDISDKGATTTFNIKIYDDVLNNLSNSLGIDLHNTLKIINIRQDNQVLRLIDTIPWEEVSLSPTISDDIEKVITDKFLTNKTQRKSKRARTGNTRNITNSAATKIATNLATIKVAKTRLKSSKGKSKGFSLLQLRALINQKLHKVLKEDIMGKSSEPPIRLRYQTGRFAKSAKVKDIRLSIGREAALDIYYSYMRQPYDVFLPGGKLYKPQRDPKMLISTAIRQIVTEKMAASYKVRTTLT